MIVSLNFENEDTRRLRRVHRYILPDVAEDGVASILRVYQLESRILRPCTCTIYYGTWNELLGGCMRIRYNNIQFLSVVVYQYNGIIYYTNDFTE
jgi:hypothetical protein